jgi:hypothetical protein
MGLIDDLEGASPSFLLWRVQRGNPTRTSEEDSIMLAFACELVIRHVSALQLRYLTRAVVSEHSVDMRDENARYDYFTGIEVVGAEIAPMLGLSKVVAQQKVATRVSSRAVSCTVVSPLVLPAGEPGSFVLFGLTIGR